MITKQDTIRHFSNKLTFTEWAEQHSLAYNYTLAPPALTNLTTRALLLAFRYTLEVNTKIAVRKKVKNQCTVF